MRVAVLVTDFSITPEAFQIDVPDHGFKELMRRCVQGAVEIVKEVNTISWQNEDQPDHADGKRQRDSAGEHS